MDNFFLVAFVYWPLVALACALLNMLVHWTFSWSELVLQVLAGIVVGVFFMLGTDSGAGGFVKFLLVMSHGLWGLLAAVGVDHFADRTNLFLWSSCWAAGGVLVAGGLDRAALAVGTSMSVGGGFLSVPIFLLKLPGALVTTGISLLMFIVGSFVAAARAQSRVGFLGGVLYCEWSTGGPVTRATTLGCVVHVWNGQMSNVIRHELYHSRQYMFMHDWLVPFWVIGGLWGWVSAAATGNWDVAYFSQANHTCEVGNPLERAAYRADGTSPFPAC